ncbi:MAG: hypothetical protein R2844_20400 [Caldilineales bacterium]
MFVASLLLLNWRRRSCSGWRAGCVAAATHRPADAVVAVRGPGFFWFNFWTNPAGRTVFVTLDVAAILWMFFVLYAVPGAPR